MSKFSVGDIVIGNTSASKYYAITKEGWKGVVVEVVDKETFWVKSLKWDSQPFLLKQQCFDLLSASLENE